MEPSNGRRWRRRRRNFSKFLVDDSWLWWIMSVILANQKWRNILNNDNCFSIFTRSDLNRIRKETIKKRFVWLTGEFMCEHEAVNSGCAKIFTVSSNMANDSFNLFVSSFVSFSINGLKENAENLDYYPILRRKVEPSLFLSTHREGESFLCRFPQMLSTAVTIKVSVVYLQCSC